jgi:NitT/TauT family transport system ATP-binding protein
VVAAPQQLSINGLSVVYQTRRGSLKALDSLDMTIGDGEFVAVLGPSGCGKSTLLKIVAGLVMPSAGEVVLHGEPVIGPRPDVGIVFQQPTLLPWKTVLDNVLVPIRAQRKSLEEYREEALSLLKLAGLEQFAEHYPNELSGGMQQRVGIVRGLIHDPRLLLMDEPFSALDAMTRERMAGELQSIWMARRKAVLFITHSIQEAILLADRIVVLSDRPGKVVEVLKVDLPRPRLSDVVSNPRFVELSAHLRSLFRLDGRPSSGV